MDKSVCLGIVVSGLFLSVVSLHVSADSAVENNTKSIVAVGLRSDGELVQASNIPTFPVTITKNVSPIIGKTIKNSEESYRVQPKMIINTSISTEPSAEADSDL